ncbi:Glycosyl transferase (modular protein) [Methylorubrum extorquens]|uniref:Glycosyl transferase (Modular protein) n=1 Tax=Methylorubrum extorquens TaxID=408 RepID=A0A2N9ALI4_METEX|nr:Glycosyl transferase (modular protein) [Methylorubrum extorquens]
MGEAILQDRTVKTDDSLHKGALTHRDSGRLFGSAGESEPAVMPNPKVTIVMPVMNGGRYFELALRSALAQTYGNIEIIVVNDGSNDGGETERIALKYSDRIRYFSQENRGVSGALNTAIRHMTGDVFTWLSHDDIYLPHKTESQVSFHRRLNRPNAILFTDYGLIDPEGKLFYTTDIELGLLTEKPLLPLHRGLVNGCTLYIPAWIIKEFYPFDESLRYTQDYDLWLRISQEHEFFLQKEAHVHYRTHPGQDSHKPGSLIERNRLFQRLMDGRSETQRVQMEGSEKRFFVENATYYGSAGIAEVAAYGHEQAALWSAAKTLVSVILPCDRSVRTAGADPVRALRSILQQSHTNLEVILVTDAPLPADLEAAIAGDPRVRRIPSEAGADPFDTGMEQARGHYLAFLDPRDTFLSDKILRQLDAMAEAGRTVSYTGYSVGGGGTEPAGPGSSLGETTYPEIIADCPVATSALMIHRTVFLGGFRFEATAGPAEDALVAIWLARRHAVLGISGALSDIHWTHALFALGRNSILERIDALCSALEADPAHSRQVSKLERLAESRRAIAFAGEADQATQAYRTTRDVAALHATARRLGAEGQILLAKDLYGLRLADEPNDPEALDALSQFAQQAGDSAGALDWLERLLETSEPSPYAFIRCMHLHQGRGALDKALQTIFHARAHYPDNEELRLQALSLLIEMGERNWARVEAERAVRTGITTPALACLASQALLDGNASLDMLQRVSDLVQRTIALNPVEGALSYFRLLRRTGRLAEAAEVVRAGLAEAPGNADLARALLEVQPVTTLPAGDAVILRRSASALSSDSALSEALSSLADFVAAMDVVPGAPHTEAAVKVLERVVRSTPPPTPRPGGPIFILSWTLARGGAERLVAMLFARLRKRLGSRPVELLLFDCAQERATSFYLSETGHAREELLIYDDVQRVEAPYKWIGASSYHQWLIELFRARKPAVLYAHLEVPNLVGGLAAVLTGVPRILLGTYNMRPPDFIDDADACHWYREGYRQLLSRPEVHLTGMAQTCVDDYADWLGVDLEGRASIVPSGFEIGSFHSALDPAARARARQTLSIDADRPVVGVVMRIALPKAPLLWVQVAASVAARRPDTVFAVIGDGPLLPAMKNAAAELGLSGAFRFTGALEDAYAALPALDVFLLTSFSEGMPNAIIEAQASGVPVVSRRVGAIDETIRPGETGVSVAGSDPQALADAVLSYLDNPERTARARQAAQAFAREHFDIERMIDRVQALVEG